MKSLNRRSFIKSTALTAAAFSLPARSWSQIEGSNSDVRVGVVGFGQRGQSHIEGFSKMSGVRVTALCDNNPSLYFHPRQLLLSYRSFRCDQMQHLRAN